MEHPHSAKSGATAEQTLAAQFTDGYSFRGLVTYLDATTGNGRFTFSADSIQYSRADSKGAIYNAVKIAGYRLTAYNYALSSREKSVGIDMGQLLRLFKPLKKSNAVCLSMQAKEPGIIVTVGTGGHSVLQPIVVDGSSLEYDPGKFVRSKRQPNCTVAAGEFVTACTNLSSGSYGREPARFQAFDSGIKFSTPRTANVFNEYKFGQIDDQVEPFHEGNIDTNVVKALSKVKNISPTNGTVRLYFEQGNSYLRVMTDIGTYGRLTVFVRVNPAAE